MSNGHRKKQTSTFKRKLDTKTKEQIKKSQSNFELSDIIWNGRL